MNKDISDKDKKDWQEFVSNKEKLPNKDINFEKKDIVNTKSIDLHGYTLDGANRIIEQFIKDSFLKRVSKITVVTGKGLHSQNEKNPYVSSKLSILKYSVPEFIKSDLDLSKHILSVSNADLSDGGDGAIIIKLKRL